MKYIDGDGNILIPKSVRPIIDFTETNLGSKKGAKKQYRYENLHIREYENYYSVHMDKVDPRIESLWTSFKRCSRIPYMRGLG